MSGAKKTKEQVPSAEAHAMATATFIARGLWVCKKVEVLDQRKTEEIGDLFHTCS